MSRNGYLWYEETHKDAEDFPKWAGEAKRQMSVIPRGAELSYGGGSSFEKWLLELGLREAGNLAVDFGCSSAYYRNLFHTMDYIGIDQNPTALGLARARWEGRDLEVGGGKTVFYETPLAKITESFPELIEVADVGISITVLQHNHIRPGTEALLGMAKVLKPGAPLMLLEATYTEMHYSEETRRQGKFPPMNPEQLGSVFGMTSFTPKGWIHFLNNHGFENTVFDGNTSYLAFKRKD